MAKSIWDAIHGLVIAAEGQIDRSEWARTKNARQKEISGLNLSLTNTRNAMQYAKTKAQQLVILREENQIHIKILNIQILMCDEFQYFGEERYRRQAELDNSTLRQTYKATLQQCRESAATLR